MELGRLPQELLLEQLHHHHHLLLHHLLVVLLLLLLLQLLLEGLVVRLELQPVQLLLYWLRLLWRRVLPLS